MIIIYKNTDLDIFLGDKQFIYDINQDLDIDMLREAFNGSIGNLSLKNNSLAYWLLSFSERNTLINDLFLDICRISLIKTLDKENEELKIITKNISLFIHFKKTSRVSLKDRFLFNLQRIFVQFKPYIHLLGFCAKTFIFRFRHVKKSAIKDLTNTIIIQTYVGANNFSNNELKDNYYGNLAEYLRKNSNKKVVTWPIFFMRPWSGNLGNNYYPTKALSNAVFFLRERSENFIILEDYLRRIDYLETYKLFFTKRFFAIKKLNIDGTNYGDLVNHYLKKELVEYGTLFYFFAKRLKELGSSNISFLINHENLKPEKALILGVREFLPDSRIVGHFHTSKPKNLLCLDYASNDEYKIAPKPDLITFNSPKFLKSFKENYNETPVINGVAFKQEYLKELSKEPTISCKQQEDTLLVLFSGNREDVKIMCNLLINVPKNVKLLLKMHPYYQFDPKEYLIDKQFQTVNDTSLIEILSKRPMVVSTYSLLTLECAISGMNVGLVYNRKRLLLNPFDFTAVENYSLISNNSQMLEFLSKPKPGSYVDSEDIFNLDKRYYSLYLSSL